MRLSFPRFLCATAVCLLAAASATASKHTAKTTAPQRAHTHHPQGWRFTMPQGDPAKGKEVFEKFECSHCHEIRGEFSNSVEDGPELSQMGPLHPVEFFAESIIHPDAVVPRKYRDAAGKSPMSDFSQKMTVRELIDVSAYIASLRPKGAPKTVSAPGKVIAVVPDRGELVIEHGEIKGFMDAMTMGYRVSPASLAKTVSPGDQVQFTIDTSRNVITRIEKTAPAAAQRK